MKELLSRLVRFCLLLTVAFISSGLTMYAICERARNHVWIELSSHDSQDQVIACKGARGERSLSQQRQRCGAQWVTFSVHPIYQLYDVYLLLRQWGDNSLAKLSAMAEYPAPESWHTDTSAIQVACNTNSLMLTVVCCNIFLVCLGLKTPALSIPGRDPHPTSRYLLLVPQKDYCAVSVSLLPLGQRNICHIAAMLVTSERHRSISKC
jgi:hypothetical protein